MTGAVMIWLMSVWLRTNDAENAQVECLARYHTQLKGSMSTGRDGRGRFRCIHVDRGSGRSVRRTLERR
jgi:hypothetical protein